MVSGSFPSRLPNFLEEVLEPTVAQPLNHHQPGRQRRDDAQWRQDQKPGNEGPGDQGQGSEAPNPKQDQRATLKVKLVAQGDGFDARSFRHRDQTQLELTDAAAQAGHDRDAQASVVRRERIPISAPGIGDAGDEFAGAGRSGGDQAATSTPSSSKKARTVSRKVGTSGI